MYLKVNVNKKCFDIKDLKVILLVYVEQLNEVVIKDRELEGKKFLKCKEDKFCMKFMKVSCIDFDSGFMVCDEKFKGFFYLDYCIVDGCYGIIVDIYVILGNVYDS